MALQISRAYVSTLSPPSDVEMAGVRSLPLPNSKTGLSTPRKTFSALQWAYAAAPHPSPLPFGRGEGEDNGSLSLISKTPFQNEI